MGNRKLYREDVYTREAEATILDFRMVTDPEGSFPRYGEVLLDRCIFFPEGGGQSSDGGSVECYPVVEVFERPALDGEGTDTWVKIDLADRAPVITGACSEAEFCFPAAGRPLISGFSLMKGDSVTCRLDWDRRFDNMQRHNGEHIMSGMFFREYGGVNRGFHMGEDYMTVDISMEDSRYPELTWEMLKNVEYCTNEAIWRNLPVTTYRFKTIDEAAASGIRMRKELPAEMEGEEISIVCIGSTENAADSVFCCGTHPARTGEVGLLKIYKFKKYKGMYRVFFEAGSRAYKNLQRDQDALNELYKMFSATPDDIVGKVEAREAGRKAKAKELVAELKALKRQEVR